MSEAAFAKSSLLSLRSTFRVTSRERMLRGLKGGAIPSKRKKSWRGREMSAIPTEMAEERRARRLCVRKSPGKEGTEELARVWKRSKKERKPERRAGSLEEGSRGQRKSSWRKRFHSRLRRAIDVRR